VTVLAASSTASQVYPGLLGFLVVAGMGLALYFLFRSLNKQLRKISPDAHTRPGANSAKRASASADPGAGAAAGPGPDRPGRSGPS
jgi:hypothetical protein